MRALTLISRRALALATLAPLALLLAGCGDSSTAGVGGEGTGGFGAVGRVDGFGSTIVEGRRLDDRDARITLDGAAAPLTAIKLGTQLALQAEGERLLMANVEAEVIGPLAADLMEDRGEFTVLGQRVVIGGHPALAPVLEGVTDLLAGTQVEVHGLRRADGAIVPTRIQVRAPSLATVRLRGTVAALDTTARRFRIGDLTVNYAGAALAPAGSTLANGRSVTLTAPRSALAGTLLAAQTLRIDPAPTDGVLELTGLVTQAGSAAAVRVRDVAVDASAARFAPGASAADLRTDQLLRVRGRVSGGVLRAEDIAVVRSAADLPIDVTAPLTDFSGADNVFRLRGANVRITPQTQFVGGSTDNLANGVPLRVTGALVDGDVVASRLQWVTPAPVVAGTVSALDPVAGTLRLTPLAQPVRLTAATVFRNGTRADLANGRRVRVSGVAGSGEFAAVEVTFLESAATPFSVLLTGVASDLNPSQRLFINDTQVTVNAQTAITGGATGTAADLDGGQFLIVRAVRQGTELIARSIEIRLTLDDDFAHVIGYVAQFRDTADFRVAGQRVDARSATVTGGAVRDAAYVVVEGSMIDGVLRARRVDVLPD
jgi:hypothetical protein